MPEQSIKDDSSGGCRCQKQSKHGQGLGGNPQGRVGFWAKVTKDVMAGQVEGNACGSSLIHSMPWQNANTNYVTYIENRDPISGFPVYTALLCEVRKRN